MAKGEKERERRRARDREKRQSMSLEEREKRLARRRRNYQLRRRRAGQAQSYSQLDHSVVCRGEEGPRSEKRKIGTASELSTQSEGTNVEGLEVGARKLAEFPRRLRLIHIRHLARTLNVPASKLSGGNQFETNAIAAENSNNSTSPKRLRLNRVKRLARTLHSKRVLKEMTTAKQFSLSGTESAKVGSKAHE